MRRLCQLALLAGLLPGLAAADVYRWVDEDGVVNYSQREPEGVEAERMRDGSPRERRAAPAPAAPDPAQAEAAGESELSERQQRMLAKLRAREQARQEEIEQARDANCKKARALLQRLTSSGRIRVRADDGSERVMPEEEHQERIADAQRAIAENCVP